MDTTRLIRALIGGLSLAFLMVSCEEEPLDPTPVPDPEPKPVTYSISVTPNGTVEVPAEGGMVEFKITTSNTDYYGYTFPKRDWMSGAIEKDRKVIVITFLANDSGSERSNEVTFFGQLEGAKDDEYVVTEKVKVVQAAKEGGQTISSAGGTVQFEGFSITFPEGALSKPASVEITPAEKGSVLGDDEISAFYEVTLPPLLNKPLTVSIPCGEVGDDVYVVSHTPCYHLSEGEGSFSDRILESTYADGVYTVTLPATNNNDVEDGDVLKVSLGVAHRVYTGKGNSTKASSFDEKFTEGNVSWHFEWPMFFKWTYAEQLTKHWDEINVIIREAIQALHGLGLEVTTRDIAMTFADLGVPDGTFCQSAVKDEWSTVEFNTRIIKNFEQNRDKFRRSAVHELMHVFQADYDSRHPYNKAGGIYGTVSLGNRADGDELLLLYESGAVWAEQLLGGSFSTTFAKDFIPGFIQGFENVNEIWAKDDEASTRHKQYSFHGYGASTLMQYLTSKMSEYNLGNDSVKELYLLWKTKNYWLGTTAPKDCIQELTASKGHGLFSVDYYDDFLVSLATGKLIPDFNASGCCTVARGNINKNSFSGGYSETCYPYGGRIDKYLVNVEDEELLKTKELVIEQLEEDVQTYVIIIDIDGKEAKQWEYKAWKDSPIYLNTAELLKSYRKKGGSGFAFTLFTLTTTTGNNSSKPYKVNVSLKDAASADPNNLSFKAEGGTKTVKINFGSHTRYGASVSGGGEKWCSLNAAAGSGSSIEGDTAEGLTVDISVQGNPNRQARSCTVDFWVSDTYEMDKMKFSVTVTQDGTGMQLSIGSIGFNASLKTLEHWEWFYPMDDQETERDYSFNHSHIENSMKATLTGTTLHVNEEYTAKGAYGQNQKSISFDILNFDLKKFDDCVVTNIVFRDTDKNAAGAGTSVELKISEIPAVQIDTTTYDVSLTFRATGSGVKVSSLSDLEDDGNGLKIERSYRSDSANSVRLNATFSRPSK
jgi:hypothetical protein